MPEKNNIKEIIENLNSTILLELILEKSSRKQIKNFIDNNIISIEKITFLPEIQFTHIFSLLNEKQKNTIVKALVHPTYTKNIFNSFVSQERVFDSEDFFKRLNENQKGWINEHNNNRRKNILEKLELLIRNKDFLSLKNLLLENHFLSNIQNHISCKPNCDGHPQYCQAEQLKKLVKLGNYPIEKAFLELRGAIELISLSLTSFIHNRNESCYTDTYYKRDCSLWYLISGKEIIGLREDYIIIRTNEKFYSISYNKLNCSIIFNEVNELDKILWI